MVFADSVNLGRRLSSRAENDLMQEDFMSDDLSLAQCESIANKLSNVKDLPKACKAYPDVVKSLQRRTTGTASDAAIAFQGMRAGSAAAARANRAKGKEHYAQVQRRYTQSGRFNSKKATQSA